MIRRLVDDFCRRDKPPERRNEFQFRGRKLSASEAVPFAEIAAPRPGRVVGMHRRYKPREDGVRRVPRGNLHNPRQQRSIHGVSQMPPRDFHRRCWRERTP